MSQDVTPPTPEGVKSCQKVIGELLWLVTRTRPDLMFGVSRTGASVLKSTHAIQETAKQMRLYLKATLEEGLRFEERPEDPINLYVYSDSSFARSQMSRMGLSLFWPMEVQCFGEVAANPR